MLKKGRAMHDLFFVSLNMVLLKKCVFGILLSLIATSSFAQIKFQRISLEQAKTQAVAQKKNVFIDFRADWCAPCVAMEKTTFVDPQVADAINNTYVAVKADVDYFEGMDMKEAYNVGTLPTILIINSGGAVQKRLIGQKDAASLMRELGFPYDPGKNGNTDTDPDTTTDPDPEGDPTPPKKVKKECFLVRWYNKIKRT